MIENPRQHGTSIFAERLLEANRDPFTPTVHEVLIQPGLDPESALYRAALEQADDLPKLKRLPPERSWRGKIGAAWCKLMHMRVGGQASAPFTWKCMNCARFGDVDLDRYPS